jgi:hypothetical protein
MDSRICTWNGPQLGNDLLECILFRKHVEKICPSAYHILDPFRVQEVLEFDTIHMAIRLHLEDKVADVAEAKTAVPP